MNRDISLCPKQRYVILVAAVSTRCRYGQSGFQGRRLVFRPLFRPSLAAQRDRTRANPYPRPVDRPCV